MARKEFTGNAPATTLNGAINSSVLALTLASGTGYPTGATAEFVLTIDEGNAAEEKVLCSVRTGTTVTIVSRGYDGTTAQDHANGASVKHTIDAVLMQELTDHIWVTTNDAHTQYMKTDGTRHDLTARHAYGAALGTPAAGGASAVGDTASAGTGAAAAREDHRHSREAFATPGASAVGDTAAAGSATTIPRSDHRHSREAFATPAGLGNANAAGSATTLPRSDHAHKRDLRVAKAGSDVGTRNRLNLIEGANVTLTVVDDAGNDEVDITVASTVGQAIYKDADETVSSSDAFQADNELLLALGATETWVFEFVLYFNADDINSDIKFRVDAPAGATGFWMYGLNYHLTTGALNTAIPSSNAFGAGSMPTYADGNTRSATIRGVVTTTGTAGNLQLMWALNTAIVADVRVLVGSHLLAFKKTS